MNKLLTMLLVLSLIVSSALTPSVSYAGDTAIYASDAQLQNTIRALGIMSGDEKGDLKLNRLVYRSEFAQMMVNASVYKNTEGGTSKTSVFSDVKYDFWAANAIRTAVNAGWFKGYLDGTFRPNGFITYEQAASALVKLLGYTDADFASPYPSGPVQLFESIGMSDGISRKIGERITRNDAMKMLINLMETKTKTGGFYGESVGVRLSNGRVDYGFLVESGMSGPYVYSGSDDTIRLPFTGLLTAVYRNGVPTTIESLRADDVYYVHTKMRALYIYDQKITGLVTAVMPSASAPSSIMVSGKSYALSTSEAVFQFSHLGSYKVGDFVTLLLGTNQSVVNVKPYDATQETKFGTVTDKRVLSYTDMAGNRVNTTLVEVVLTDGVVNEYPSPSVVLNNGDLVSISTLENGLKFEKMSTKTLTGVFDFDAKTFAGYKLSQDIRIIESTLDQATIVFGNALHKTTLRSGDVRYFALNDQGEIEHLILSHVTGDLNEYGLITSVDEVTTVIPSGMLGVPDTIRTTGTYSYLASGVPGVLVKELLLGLSEGGALILRNESTVNTLLNLSGTSVEIYSNITAVSNSKSYSISDSVQVYERIDGDYYPSSLASVSDATYYRLTGYYDAGFSAGGKIRIIIAQKR